MKATRTEVYRALDTEREYQDAGRGNAKYPGSMLSPGDFLRYMARYVSNAREAWEAPDGGAACLEFVRKATALGVACMEHHGAPERK